ncbi:MAG: hypothetical protein MUF87_17335 [Anaerolineae bacterium]|nr:hypothetical protein [Anaerolineae bacterium]
MITYQVAVDSADDGSWITSLSADLEALEWRLGFVEAFASVAPPGQALITVRNWTQSYSPEGVSPLMIGQWLRIVVNNQVKFTGIIREIAPMVGKQGERLATITVNTPDAQYPEIKTTLPLMIKQRTDYILDQLLEIWPLEQYSRQLDRGITVLEYVGDRWGDGVAIDVIAHDLVEAERGRLFCNHQGVMRFLNRHYALRTTAAVATMIDAMSAADYQYGADLITEVRVRIRLRSVGPSNATVWTLQTPQTVRPGDQFFWARLRSSDGEMIGAVNVIAPLAGTDYTANARSDGLGSDQTAALEITIVKTQASAVRLRLRNTSSQVIYLRPGAKLRGTPLFLGDTALIEHKDDDAAGNYGARLLELDLPLLDSIELAEQLARFELSVRQTPRGVLRSIAFDARSSVEARLVVQLFERVVISESQTGHSRGYWVIGEQHRVDERGHRLTWMLAPTVNLGYWQVGVTTLAGARLGY